MPQLKESLKISRIFRIDNHLFLLAVKTSSSVIGGDFKADSSKESRALGEQLRWELSSEMGGNLGAGYAALPYVGIGDRFYQQGLLGYMSLCKVYVKAFVKGGMKVDRAVPTPSIP